MPQPRHLRLDYALPACEEETPRIVIRGAGNAILASVATGNPHPTLPLADASVTAVDARDALEHGHDEQAWLAELARVTASGGSLLVRVPLENLTAWLDALNIYRYLRDITGRGSETQPLETLPGGWHRHYRQGEITGLIEQAGFVIDTIEYEGLTLGEIAHLAALIGCSFTGDASACQHRLFAWRDRFHHRPLMPLPRSIAGRITVRAIRTS